MAAVALLKFQFGVELNEGDGWISPNEIFNPSYFFFRMGSRMRTFRPVGTVH